MPEINQRRVEQQIRNFSRALEAYDHSEPFSRFLTKFFKENKQMGSSDRRMTSRLCYNLFRLGQALPALSVQERLISAEFLCEETSDVVGLYRPAWLANISSPLPDKIDFLAAQGISVREGLFPFSSLLSSGVDAEAFLASQLVQPDLFIRVQKHAVHIVEAELTKNGIAFTQEGNHAYRLPNRSNLQALNQIAGLYEVQDLSSQHSLDFAQVEKNSSWWDACAASGGKSLLLLEKQFAVNLLVSDVRLSILRNLDERFEKARVNRPYRKKVLDLTENIDHLLHGEQFDGIILDAPCSGSGTWGRTPEMIQQFSVAKIKDFTDLQRKIAKQAVKFLKPEGQLIYITCSVFEEENEGMLQFLQENCGLLVEEQQLIEGYQRKSDSMFAARLRKI